MTIYVKITQRDSEYAGPSCDFKAQSEFPEDDLRDLSPSAFSERYLTPILAQARNAHSLFERSSEDF